MWFIHTKYSYEYGAREWTGNNVGMCKSTRAGVVCMYG